MSDQRMPAISRADKQAAGLYDALITRYKGLPIEKGIPLMAVRLLTLRWGLDVFLERLVVHGTAVVAERCRNEMVERQHFMARMLADYPPDSLAEAEGAIEEMAEDLATIDCEEGALFLLTYLDRLRGRELMRTANNGTVH